MFKPLLTVSFACPGADIEQKIQTVLVYKVTSTTIPGKMLDWIILLNSLPMVFIVLVTAGGDGPIYPHSNMDLLCRMLYPARMN